MPEKKQKKISATNENDSSIIEKIDETSIIEKPFNPNEIIVETQQLTLWHIISRLQNNEINFFTEFQRLPNLWDNIKQSRLIESILLRLPIPSFYFDAKDDDKWDIVDGLQRVSTINNFIVNKTLKLINLEYLTQFENKGYDDLPRELIRKMDSFPIIVSLIQKGTPPEVKFNLFSRINTGGLILTAQEIRHALNQGKPAELVKELAETEEFKQATCKQILPDRMEDRTFATRFIAFYLNIDKYEPDMESFLNNGMAAIAKLDSKTINRIKKRFKNAMQLAFDIFGKDAFRKRFNLKDVRSRPINIALFEAISVNFANLSEKKCEILKSKKRILKGKFITLCNNKMFERIITTGTASNNAVANRHKEIKRIIDETLGAAK